MFSADDDIVWPPPDPDRMPRTRMKLQDVYEADKVQKDIVTTKNGQRTDIVQRRKRFHERYTDTSTHDELDAPGELQADGEEAWRNSEGERLADFGLDEEAEFYDDEGNVTIGS